MALHHNGHQPEWLNMTLNQFMQSAEAKREMAEYIAPKMQKFVSDMQTFADAFNRAMEPYRELGRQMATMLQTYQKQAEHVGRTMRMAQPYLDAINREFARRNVIVSSQIIDVELVDSKSTLEAARKDKIIKELPKNAEHLCDRMAFWREEGYLLFQVPTGWAAKKIGNQAVAIILKLRERAQRENHEGLRVEDMNDISNAKTRREKNRVVHNRIRDLRVLCNKYGAPHIILSKVGERWYFNKDLLLSPEKFSKALTKCSQDER